MHKFRDNELWWHGPQWLTFNQDEWPETEVTVSKKAECDYESGLKKSKQVKEINCLSSAEATCENYSVICSPFEIDSDKYSSVTKLLRVTAYCARFIHKLKKATLRMNI